MSTMSIFFGSIELSPPVEVFALNAAFSDDTDSHKVNLGIGAFQTDEGKSYILPVVRTVEAQILADHTLDHEYLPIEGLPAFRTATAQLLLGKNSRSIVDNLVDGIQTIGGTGAVRIGMDLLHSVLGYDIVYVPKPTWPNHIGIAKSLQYPSVKEYRYWDYEKCCVDFEGMIEDLRAAPKKSVVMLQMCAHNPTGMDLSLDQWKKVAAVIKEKGLFPFFDGAYQGFASEDLAMDAASVRLFEEEGLEMLIAQTFSKNFGLYGERIGTLLFIVNNAEQLPKVRSHLVTIARRTWNNPPSHGARIVSTILNNPQLYHEWTQTLRSMAQRIQTMRQLLFQKMKALGTPGSWDHIVQQKGMFCYTGLSARQVEMLVKEYHIYLMRDGRINMCGITSKNAEYVAKAFYDAITKFPSNC